MLRRQDPAPLITRADVSDVAPAFTDVSSVFNPGAVRVGDRTLLMLRVQSRGRESGLMRAWIDADGACVVEPELVCVRGLEAAGGTVHHVYDPRLTLLDGVMHAVLAVDVDETCRLAVARADERFDLDVLDVDARDARNGVLFPERIGGRWLRLERPNVPSSPGEPPSGDVVTLAESDDLTGWRDAGPVFRGRPRGWDERVGAGPPPLKTREGWLLVYHGVATHFGSVNVYQAGAVLLDRDDPTRVLARTRRNILEPRETWELVGQVPNVVFPSGLVADAADDDGCAPREAQVRIYYGAADTCVGVAAATVGDLLDACRDEETP